MFDQVENTPLIGGVVRTLEVFGKNWFVVKAISGKGYSERCLQGNSVMGSFYGRKKSL